MLANLLERMSAPPRSASAAEVLRASSDDSILTAINVDASSNAQSSSSTPPTSIDDGGSTSFSSAKFDSTDPTSANAGRSKRTRTSVGTYNVKILAGTSIHAPKKYSKDPEVVEVYKRKSLGQTLANALLQTVLDEEEELDAATENDDFQELNIPTPAKKVTKTRSRLSLGGSPKKTAKQKDFSRRQSVKLPTKNLESISKRMSSLGKRGRAEFEGELSGLSRAKREVRNLADTPEFAKIELKPVIHEVWSNGKLVTAEQPPKKKTRVEELASASSLSAMSSPRSSRNGKGKEREVEVDAEEDWVDETEVLEIEDEPKAIKLSIAPRKKYLNKGLYAGQDGPSLNWFKYDKPTASKSAEDIADLDGKKNIFMPMPMWHGQRLLILGRDFKLPWDVCSPLPPGQSKPEDWKKTSTNRFVGEARDAWRVSKWKDSASSKCICTPASGCDEDCQNRIMLYECDDSNCGAGRSRCTNRSFAELAERRKLGGKYRIGVEVVKTQDRGYGVRSNRCFDANQIIVEYTGEIITESECDRRMKEVYKKNECYYLMSFDQGMILDGTKGSIARFINHSCRPNCKMVKWYVGGTPRMALFAGDNEIMTGDELTYDYNFDPFSAKNVQECRCGSDNCRGVLGPKPKPKKPTEIIKEVIKAGVKRVKAGKRKLMQLYAGPESGDEEEAVASSKKRKVSDSDEADAPVIKKKRIVKSGYTRGPYKKRDASLLVKPRRAYKPKDPNEPEKPKRAYKKREPADPNKPRRAYNKREVADPDTPERAYTEGDSVNTVGPVDSVDPVNLDKPKRSYKRRESTDPDKPKRTYVRRDPADPDKPRRSYKKREPADPNKPKRVYGPRGPYKKRPEHLLARPRAVPKKSSTSNVIHMTAAQKKSVKTYGKGKAKLASTEPGLPIEDDSDEEFRIATPGNSVRPSTENSVRKNAAREMRGIRKGSRGPSPEATITLAEVIGTAIPVAGKAISLNSDDVGLSSLGSPVEILSEWEDNDDVE